MLTLLCIVGGVSSVAAFLIGFVPPSQFSGGGSAYVFIVLAGAGIVGFIAPIALLYFRKPSWKVAANATGEVA